MRRYAIPLATVLALALPGAAAPAAAAATPDELLRHLAANQTHSWIQDDLGVDAMVARYRAGERLYVSCGNVAEIGRRLLQEAGYPARVVQVLTRGAFDYLSDGHLMTEVFADGRWQLYDLDANLRAVDASGQGVSVVEQVAAVREGRALWEPIAADPLYRVDEPDTVLRELAREIFSDPQAFYARVMGIALLPRDPAGTVNQGMYFHDADQVTRLAAYPHGSRFFADDDVWQALVSSAGPAPAPATAP